MRIAQLATVELRVPPTGYGGIELVASLLTEELVRRGHEVTLFASGDSVTSARLHSICPHFIRGSNRDKGIWTMLNVVACLEQADRFDIIHNHTCFEGLAPAGLVKTPMLSTFHDVLKGDNLALFAAYKGYYNTISRSAKALLPEKEGFIGVIYNAIDCGSYPFVDRCREGYLLFLGRISPDKGPHLAIEAARRLKRRLIIAGNATCVVDEHYFNQRILPQVDGDIVQFFGEADSKQKRELLANALCLLMPITWPEPFGLVIVEAMACGTPVIVFNRGSAPEVVLHGKTGFIVEDVDEMVEAVGKIHCIQRSRCREHVERNFDVPRMVDDYLHAYERILNRQVQERSVSIPELAQTIDHTISNHGKRPLEKPGVENNLISKN
jgi:glycosyltransferase involved in cell wall biosynthesis